MHYAAHLLVRWNALPKGARAIVAAGALAIVSASILGGVFAHPPRTTLFAAPLHPEQLAEVEERLAGWNVSFTPGADNVIVDTGRRNDLLLRLSLAGVPHPHLESTGETLASVGVLTPQAVIDAQTRAGLAGDIEAGLRGVDGVDDARVIVAPAKLPEFADETARDASASVRLRLRSGVRLSREAVAGVRAFVAASVAGLEPAHVTILDDRGVALGDRAGDGGDDDGAQLQLALQSALDAAFGDGATIVRIRAEYRGDGVTERDVPGSQTHEAFSQSAPGGLKRLSTAVFVDQYRGVELAKVRDLAAAAVGYDAQRGDTLAVEAVDFRRSPAARKDAWWLLYGAIVPLAPALVLALGSIAAARFAMPPLASLVRSLLERAAVERTSKAAAGFAPARVRSLLAQEPPHAAAAIISALPAATAAAVLDLYPPHEREAIVRRMQRPHSRLLDDAEELLRRHA